MNAMDYRPIALLQSGYKVVAKVLCNGFLHDTVQIHEGYSYPALMVIIDTHYGRSKYHT